MKKGFKSEKGQGLTEYGLILLLVAVAAIGIMTIFGSQIKEKLTTITSALSGNKTVQSDVKTKQEATKKKLDDSIKKQAGKEASLNPDSKDFTIGDGKDK